LAGYIPRWCTRPRTVTHLGTNRARRGLTSFVRRTPLTTTPRRQPMCLYTSSCVGRRTRYNSLESFVVGRTDDVAGAGASRWKVDVRQFERCSAVHRRHAAVRRHHLHTDNTRLFAKSLHLHVFIAISPPAIGERSIVMTVSVRVCVFLSVREHISGNTRPISTKFLCVLPVAVARSFSGGVAISYALPVLWMTSYLRISQGSSTWPPS